MIQLVSIQSNLIPQIFCDHELEQVKVTVVSEHEQVTLREKHKALPSPCKVELAQINLQAALLAIEKENTDWPLQELPVMELEQDPGLEEQ